MKPQPVHPLHQYRILIADPDIKMAKVLKTTLEEMGFMHIQIANRSQDAIYAINESPVDFLITEWNFNQLKGMELIKHVRRDPGSSNPTLPIMTLTGRAEINDVVAARDSGTNEYVLKPFSAQTIYAGLERLVEHPRNFIVSAGYVGPERRIKNVLPEGMTDRRKSQPVLQQKHLFTSKEIKDDTMPVLFKADYSLKEKLGKNTTLNSVITPEVLHRTQTAITATAKESLQWVREDLVKLKAVQKIIFEDKKFEKSDVVLLSDIALTISSRIGTFGYEHAAKIAYMLSRFCREDLNPAKPAHSIIVAKHIDALEITLNATSKETNAQKKKQIIEELQLLTFKYGN